MGLEPFNLKSLGLRASETAATEPFSRDRREKKMENEMETGIIYGIIGDYSLTPSTVP